MRLPNSFITPAATRELSSLGTLKGTVCHVSCGRGPVTTSRNSALSDPAFPSLRCE